MSRQIKEITNEELGRFVADHVKMNVNETKEVKKVIDPLLRELGSTLGEGDCFVKQPHYGGSFYKNTKVVEANEFDIQFEIKPFLKKENLGRDDQPRNYAFFASNGSRMSEASMKAVTEESKRAELRYTNSQPICISNQLYTFVKAPRTAAGEIHPQITDIEFEGDVISFLAQKKFKSRIENFIARKESSWGGCGSYIKRVEMKREYAGPSITLEILLQNPNINVKLVSLDLMIALPVRIHPPFSEWGWPRPETRAWLSPSKIQAIQSKTMNVVAKKPYYWDMVDADLYKEIFENIDDGGGCRKECLRILKTMRDKYWNGDRDWSIIKSFMLENLLLRECEKYPHADDWKVAKRAERFQGLMQSLLLCLRKKELPHYFNSQAELLKASRKQQELDDQRRVIEEFMKKPTSVLAN